MLHAKLVHQRLQRRTVRAFAQDYQPGWPGLSYLSKSLQEHGKVLLPCQAADCQQDWWLTSFKPGVIQRRARLLTRLWRHDRVVKDVNSLARQPCHLNQVISHTLGVTDNIIGPGVEALDQGQNHFLTPSGRI